MRHTLNLNETELRVLRIAVEAAKGTGAEVYTSCRCGWQVLAALLVKIDKAARIERETGK